MTRLYYPHIGGVERHVSEVSKILIHRGHEVSILTEQLTATKKNEKRDGSNIYRIKTGSENKFKKFRIWYEVWRLRDLIKKSDVIHCHDVFFWYLPFRFLFPHKKVYTTFHGYESYPIRRTAVIIRKISEKLSFGNICIGDFIKKWYGTKPTFVSYGGVRIDYKKTNLTVSDESAVFIGRLDEQTGIVTYVEGFKDLLKKYPKFEFIVVGDGKYRKYLPGDKIKAVGFKDNPETYLKQANFAFVSRYLTILEAFACRKLVFAVYDNYIKEDYLKMSPFRSWINIANNKDQIVKQVEYFLKNSDKASEIIEKAFNWVSKNTWEDVANLYIKLWS